MLGPISSSRSATTARSTTYEPCSSRGRRSSSERPVGMPHPTVEGGPSAAARNLDGSSPAPGPSNSALGGCATDSTETASLHSSPRQSRVRLTATPYTSREGCGAEVLRRGGVERSRPTASTTDATVRVTPLRVPEREGPGGRDVSYLPPREAGAGSRVDRPTYGIRGRDCRAPTLTEPRVAPVLAEDWFALLSSASTQSPD